MHEPVLPYLIRLLESAPDSVSPASRNRSLGPPFLELFASRAGDGSFDYARIAAKITFTFFFSSQGALLYLPHP